MISYVTARTTPGHRGPGVPAWLRDLCGKVGAEDPLRYLAFHSRSFRFASRFLPAREARMIAEVYAFCRFTDDLVDGHPELSPNELESRLEDWARLARLAHAGETTGLPVLDIPLGRMGREGIAFGYAGALIEGVRMDIRPRTFADAAELETYTHRVAAVVGQLLTELVGVRGTWVLSRAGDLGHAMQLTNILRDVGEDWNRGRVYLPLDAMARHGLVPEDIAKGREWTSPPKAWRDLMEELMEIAEKRYRMAFQGIPQLPEFFQRPVLVAALVYRDIHAALRANGYDNFRRRAYSSRLSRLSVGLRSLWLIPSLRALYPAQSDVPVSGSLVYGT
jgi:15-cis-phytoene synthase